MPELFGFSKWFDSIGRSLEAVIGRKNSLFFWARSAIIWFLTFLLCRRDVKSEFSFMTV